MMLKENISPQTRLNLGYENMTLLMAFIPSAIFLFLFYIYVSWSFKQNNIKTNMFHVTYQSSTLIYILDIIYEE